MISTEKKIKAAVKMTDEEFSIFAQDAKARLDSLPPGPKRQSEIKEIILDFDVTYGNEMDVRNNFNAPVSALELRELVAEFLFELGYGDRPKTPSGPHP